MNAWHYLQVSSHSYYRLPPVSLFLISHFYVNSKSRGAEIEHRGRRHADAFWLKTAANSVGGERDKREGETGRVIIFFYCKLNWSLTLLIKHFYFVSFRFLFVSCLVTLLWLETNIAPLPVYSLSHPHSLFFFFILPSFSSSLFSRQVFSLSLLASLLPLLQPTLSLSALNMNIRHSDSR